MACIDTRLNAIIMEMNTHTSYQVYQAIHTINSHTDIVHQWIKKFNLAFSLFIKIIPQ